MKGCFEEMRGSFTVMWGSFAETGDLFEEI